MAKNKWFLLATALMVTVNMSAQFGFGNPAQFARQQAAKKAAEAEQSYQKGNEYLEAKKYDKAFAAYEKAANDGHAGAQYNLAAFYVEGKVVPQDMNKALEWFEKAANQGLKDAQFNLATIYHQGAGVPKDEEKAEYWAKVYKDIIKLEPKKEAAPPAFPFPPRQMEPAVDAPDVQAEFPGGQQALMTWLSQNMHYPEEAVEANAQGRVLVGFIINQDGSIDEVKVVRSVHPALDEEAMRVVKSMPKWTPGKKDGKIVRVSYTLPITFRMAEDTEKKQSDTSAENGTNEQGPSFPGGINEMSNWLSKNMKYPVEAQENGIQGVARVSFYVETDGSLEEVKIEKSSGSDILDKEAVRVVKSMPAWQPAQRDGNPVRARAFVPLSFSLH